MNRTGTTLGLLLLCAALARPAATAALRHLESDASAVTIEVDGKVETRGWVLSPEAMPDIFEVRVTSGVPRAVRFVSDRGALTFEVEAGRTYDFVIDHRGQACHTRIVGKAYVPPKGLELEFDFEFARTVTRLVTEGHLDTAQPIAALPATAPLLRKMRLNDADAFLGYLREQAKDGSVVDGARTTLARLDGGELAGLPSDVRRRLQPYLPPGLDQRIQVFFLFGGSSSGFAFGGDDVYVNLGKFTRASADEIAGTVTHEVFHAVQARVMPPFPVKDWDGTGPAGPNWVRALLHNLAQEGTAELFTHVGSEGLGSAFSREIALKNQRNAGRIAGIVVMFESLAFRLGSTPPVDYQQYDGIYGLMFYETFDATAYQLGWVMAKAIEDRDGQAAITRLLAQGPKAFLLRYQEIAQADPKLPRFSDPFLALVRSL
jgi:hypothetical protein